MRKNVFKVLFAILLFLGMDSIVSAEELTPDWKIDEEITVSYSKIATGNIDVITLDGEGTVILNSDLEACIVISKNSNIVLNLNGNKLQALGNKAIITNNGTVNVIGNGMVISKGTNTGLWGNPTIINGAGATMTLDDGIYTRSANGYGEANSSYIVRNIGTLVIEDGAIFNPGDTPLYSSSLITSGWGDSDEANFGYTYDSSIKVYTVINGGTFEDGKRAVTVEIGSTATINNGNFTNKTREIVKSAGFIEINGGTFNSPFGVNVLTTEADGTIEVINGDFSQDVSSYMNVDSESIKNDDGTYTVNFVYADYSKIDEIIEKVIDEGVDTYTKESITVLEQELEKVDWELGKSKQADVDKMADAVTKAYKQLKKIENPATNSNAEIIVSIILLALMFVGIRLSMKKRENNA